MFSEQIRDIVDAAGRVKSQYDKRMDAALRYVKNLGVPKETQDKVRTWFLYHWQQQKIVGEVQIRLNTVKFIFQLAIMDFVSCSTMYHI